MLRSMYSGIGGMKNFQVKLDVIGNNIANVNTYGYKKGRTTFKDLVSQQIAGASAPSDTKGGVNPKQVGLGSQLGSIDTIHTQGSLQTTGRPLDLGISGDGFFIVNDGINNFFTRAGNFYMDENGTLVNSDGLLVQGNQGNDPADDVLADTLGEIVIPKTAQSFSIGSDGKVTFIENGELLVAGQILIAKFPNTGGLDKVGDNLYQETSNSGSSDGDDSGTIDINDFNIPGTGGAGSLVSGALEMSNVDLSEEFTDMIVAQRGFQANTRIITTSDEILQELVNLKR
ncbi:flagellar basal body rod protein FlgG [Cytobacillus sp. S13-E01]|uniref:flagellar basal body rod protein FlgG n=1 Tax=Cytobacillus sp. S13-E01 TaxID=3031326 RepID=UPI0023D85598|nr:flagellar basal body rod protein FlgG [Cytobacillus sp. S13-E01]MDF0725181.1 flagellar basal body rod protein FlgG [Cytobacillus sp. S13-E01]